MNFTIKDVFIPWEDGYASIDVQVVNTKIAAMGADLDVIGTEIAGKNKLLLPGFFNAHTHSSEMWQRGVVSMLPLELWLAELYDFAPLDVEKVYLSALATAVETLLSGGTSVVDHLVLIPGEELATIGAAVRAYREVGIRALIAPLIQDEPLKAGIPLGRLLQGEAPCLRSTAETLAIIEQAVRDFHCPDEGVTMLVAPTGIQLCSDALFIGCVELSDKYDLCRHSHLLETQAQAMVALEKHGCTAVEHLQRLGYLGDRTSLAHCIWLTDNDITILAASQSSVVHNPLSNLRLGSGIAPIFKYLKAGVNIALGCVGASSNDSQDLLEAIKIGSILHNVTASEYRSWITPRQSVNMAAFGGAKAFKLLSLVEDRLDHTLVRERRHW